MDIMENEDAMDKFSLPPFTNSHSFYKAVNKKILRAPHTNLCIRRLCVLLI